MRNLSVLGFCRIKCSWHTIWFRGVILQWIMDPFTDTLLLRRFLENHGSLCTRPSLFLTLITYLLLVGRSFILAKLVPGMDFDVCKPIKTSVCLVVVALGRGAVYNPGQWHALRTLQRLLEIVLLVLQGHSARRPLPPPPHPLDANEKDGNSVENGSHRLTKQRTSCMMNQDARTDIRSLIKHGNCVSHVFLAPKHVQRFRLFNWGLCYLQPKPSAFYALLETFCHFPSLLCRLCVQVGFIIPTFLAAFSFLSQFIWK